MRRSTASVFTANHASCKALEGISSGFAMGAYAGCNPVVWFVSGASLKSLKSLLSLNSSAPLHCKCARGNRPDGATDYRRGCNPRLGIAIKPPPPCADGAREGAGGGCGTGPGGHASLTPVCTLSPLQGLIVLWQSKAQSRHPREKRLRSSIFSSVRGE